jgi:hypothetical protein
LTKWPPFAPERPDAEVREETVEPGMESLELGADFAWPDPLLRTTPRTGALGTVAGRLGILGTPNCDERTDTQRWLR